MSCSAGKLSDSVRGARALNLDRIPRPPSKWYCVCTSAFSLAWGEETARFTHQSPTVQHVQRLGAHAPEIVSGSAS